MSLTSAERAREDIGASPTPHLFIAVPISMSASLASCSMKFKASGNEHLNALGIYEESVKARNGKEPTSVRSRADALRSVSRRRRLSNSTVTTHVLETRSEFNGSAR